MKKKIALAVISIFMFLCAFGLGACGEIKKETPTHTPETPAHVHSYSWTDNGDGTHDGHCSAEGCDKPDVNSESHTWNNDKCSKCKAEKPSEEQKVFKTVTFDLNGGNGSIADMQFEVGKVMATLPSPTRDGYTFICWEILGEEYTAASVMPNHDLQLRAKWEKNIGGYSDDYVSFKPASEGVKNPLIQSEYNKDVDKFVYVEITSDDLGGAENIGKANNFSLRNIDGMDYRVEKGYTWAWYQGDFNTPNGAQRFTLNYGSNIQFVTVSSDGGVVIQTYLLDIYVRRDYYMSLYENIFAENPYKSVRVIENDRFPADTEVKDVAGFTFDARVYYNEDTGDYQKFVYTTAITKDWSLYQTYKPVTIASEIDGGTLDGELTVTPYTQYFTLPSPEKEGYDFLGWQLPSGEYLTNVQGYSGVNYISKENNPEKLTAVYAKKKYYYTFKNDILNTYKTVPVVTYTDKTMRSILDITYVPYNTDCALPIKTAQKNGEIFTEWQHYYLDNGEFGKNLSRFDFNRKVISPIALAPETSETDGFVVPLNGELTSRNTGTYKMYLPANKRYTLTVSTTGSVNIKLNKYGATENAQTFTVNSASPTTVNLDYYVYNLGSPEYSHGYVTFEVTSVSGSFTAKLTGDTAITAGSPAVTNDTNTAELGERFSVKLVKPGYAFDGWYVGDTKISEDQSILMEDSEREIKAKWFVCPVTLERSIPDAGSVSGLSGTTVIGEDVTVTATTNEGYTWVGWTDESGKIVEAAQSFTFAMPAQNVKYIAKWTYYTLTTERNNNDAGAITYKNAVKTTAGDSVTITATTNRGYTFVGWYNGETELTKELSYTFEMPSENVTYTAKWIKVTLDRNNTEAGSISSLGDKYKVGDSVTVTATTKNGYTWLGWYNGETEITKELSYTFEMPAENVTYTAKWIKVTLDRSNTEAGSISSLGDKYKVGDSVTVTATTKNGYTWLGWYNGDTVLSQELSYTFTMPAHNATYTAKWTYYTLTTERNNANAGSVTNKNAVKTTAGDSVTITATTNSGYTFVGWYNDETELTKELSYTFEMPSESVTYMAKWIKVTLDRNNTEAGSISSLGDKYKVGDSVTVTATTKNGYTWLGWYNGETAITKELSYTFEMPAENVTYTAKWIKVTLDRSNTEAGSISSLGDKYKVGDSVTVTATTKNGYTWLGWYNGDTVLSQELSYTFTMPAHNATYTAKWAKLTLDRNDTDAGTITSLDATYKAEQEVTITATTNSGYTFLGWYNGETELTKELSYTFEMPSENATYTAKWTYYTLTTARNNSYAGTVTTKDAEKTTAGQEVTVTATTNNGYTFLGWYNGDTELTKELSYTFDMPAENVIYTAKWTYYTLTTARNNSSAGTVTTKNAVKTTVGQEVTVIATTNIGYTFIGWYNGETELTKELSYTFAMPAENVIYTAKWTYYTLTTAKNYNYAGSVTTKDAVKTTAGQKVTVTATTYRGYNFLGWYNGETELTKELSYTFDMPSENITYTAQWAINDEMLNFEFTSSTRSLTIEGVKNKTITEIVIPDYVTGIDSSAFSNLGLTSITFAGNSQLVYIGESAFYGCGRLTSIAIPSGVTSIEREAFYDCRSMTNVTFAENSKLTRIDYRAFYECSRLTSIVLPDGVTSIGQYAFSECTRLASVTIPDSVTNISNYAFKNCRELSSITIPNSVTSINDDLFDGCSGLMSITLPFVGASKDGTTNTHFGYIFGANNYSDNSSRVPISLKTVIITGGTSIGERAFYGCSGLTSITIPDSVTSIGSNAFSGCNGLTSITIPFVGGSIKTASDTYQYPFGYIFGTTGYTGGTAVKQYYYGNSASSSVSDTYYIPSSLVSVTVTGGNILYGAFCNCSSLTSIAIPNILTSIEDNAFQGCSGLTSITIPSDVTSIGQRAFSGCRSLTSITIPSGVTSIVQGTFYDCGGLTHVMIPSGVTSIGKDAFSGCGSLTEIRYMGDITSWCKIDNHKHIMNYGKSDRKLYVNDVEIAGELLIPSSVASIGDEAFRGCSSLTSITFAGNSQLTSIGESAFAGSGLTSITIPSSVASIERNAFYACSSLTSITFAGNSQLTSIGESVFAGCGITNITIPSSVTSIGYQAFFWCSSLTSITIPSSVTSIGREAFYRCSKLTSITISESVTSIGIDAFRDCSELTINCEVAEQPSGWSSGWNPLNRPVVWNCKNK